MTDTSEEYFRRLVNVDRLREYLEAELGPAEEYEVRRHAEGHSNETLFVTWGEKELVVRRPPPGETADTAHDVLREFRVMDALQDTEVRVPPTVLASDDQDVMGSDFYVMERVDGDVLRRGEPDRFQNAHARKKIGEELVDTLAEIHAVDYEAVGLEVGDFGYPPGFTERQVRRWSEQLMWAFSVTNEEREVPELYEVMEWLQDNVPEDPPATLVHGDYKLDNVMFGPADEPEIVAIFDWEMSTLGDPFTDLGWMLSYWWDEKDPVPPTGTDTLMRTFMTHEDYPTRTELVARYEDLTGFEFENDRFYRTLAVYKLAGLGEMFFRRYLEGNSDDPMYPKMEDGVPALAERAMRIIEGEEPL
ncbi:phosphotransferase family protein [Salinirubellus salinus]|uniref:Phosphotransferase family protein n=1 Tax=Salinirubellus salinus TaxID=1364945 RepID=A0A9E7UBY7_9EURY|nr:phosphotransferase family protein [Salinirubellus salinus]UWM55667.1 phosphotransferase family protein [Salinirubellus salinus]